MDKVRQTVNARLDLEQSRVTSSPALFFSFLPVGFEVNRLLTRCPAVYGLRRQHRIPRIAHPDLIGYPTSTLRALLPAVPIMADQNLLQLAAEGDLKGLNAYVNAGGDVNHKNSMGINAVIATAFAKGDLTPVDAVLKELLRLGADPEHAVTLPRNAPSMRALHFACAGGRTELVVTLVDAGVDVNATDGMGQTPLLRAVQGRHTAIIELLLSKGADPSTASTRGCTPLIMLADPVPEEEGEQDWDVDARLGRMLLSAGANADEQDEDGHTALIWCAYSGHHELAEVLIPKVSNVNMQDAGGDTALFAAVVRTFFDRDVEESRGRRVIELLMRADADAENIKNNKGQTPWSLACSKKRPDVMKLIDKDLIAASLDD